MPIRITFWGAAQAVTGSMHAISIENETHLLKCGLRLEDRNTPVPPLYTVTDAENVTRHFERCALHERKTIGDGIQVEFNNAGHILGSAFALLECVQNGKRTRILFSGDLGRPGVPILRDPDPAVEADYSYSRALTVNRGESFDLDRVCGSLSAG
ncbi:MAG: hypothetical protein JO138_00975 [Acidobacteriaceae bacterium]|nr:hypothetical protein [Acidobacteriaceae bacterium]